MPLPAPSVDSTAPPAPDLRPRAGFGRSKRAQPLGHTEFRRAARRAVVAYLIKGIALLISLTVARPTGRAKTPETVPLAVTFSPADLQGESPIWQVAETEGGQIIAGGERILFYENNRWQALASPRKPAIRALLVDGNTLWVASQNEIGRLTLPLTAQSRYQPLAIPALAEAGEFWCLAKQGQRLIATTKDEIWFISPDTGELRRERQSATQRLFLVPQETRLIVSQLGSPLGQVQGDRLVPLANPLPDPTDLGWHWADADRVVTVQAFYRKEGAGYRAIASTNAINQKSVIADVTAWRDRIALATLNAGLWLIDGNTGETTSLNRSSGLPAITTTCVFEDRKGRLWVGTNQGLYLAEAPRFGRRLLTKDYPIQAIRHHGLLLGYEDRSEYYREDGHEERLSRAFTLTPTRYGLAVGLFNKTFVGGREFTTPGNRVGTILELPDGRLLVGVGERLYLIEVDRGDVTPLPAPSTEISRFTVAGGQLWGVTVEGDILRSPPAPPFAFTKVAKLPSPAVATLHSLGDTFISASSDGIRFGEQLQLVTHTAGVRSPRLANTADGALWLVAEQGGEWRLGRVKAAGGGVAWEVVEAKGLASLATVRYLSASGGTLLICAESSILELNTRELLPAYRLDPPRMEFTVHDAKTGATVTASAPPSELTADDSSLTLTGTLPFDEFGERPAYERRLLPTQTAWIPTKAGEKIVYPSLGPRDYTLEVRATHLGRTGEVVRRSFTVLQPWYFSFAAFCAYGAGGVVIAFATYRFRTEQIRRRNEELQRLVDVRTRELAEASAAKTEFLASMSHEIRNPMNGVIGLVNILREQPGLPRQANTLRLLHGCAEQLRATVDDILDFSKIEARKTGLEISTFDLLDTLEAAAATVDPSGASIAFADKPPPGLSLRGDAAKLRQIFANYLTNALKYGVPPGARVSTILKPESEGRVRLTLSVTSTGPTIEKDKLDKLFESFTRGADAIERNIRGTGLGLAICKRYAEAMGGEVGAVSTNGETTFYLNVPFEKRSESVLPAPAEEPAAPRPALLARALAIEDEDYNRIVLGDILAKMNYSVDWATTGAEALQLAQENGYDIILTDYRLPDTNGVELTKKILKFCPDPKPAVFAVTAYSTKERRDECLGAGMSGFISKPITLEKLRTTLFSWGDSQLTKISLEANVRPSKTVSRRHAEIEEGWGELKRIATTDAKLAAAQAHKLNNLCRSLNQIDIAEQLELLEGALERHEPTGQLVAAIERLLRA